MHDKSAQRPIDRHTYIPPICVSYGSTVHHRGPTKNELTRERNRMHAPPTLAGCSSTPASRRKERKEYLLAPRLQRSTSITRGVDEYRLRGGGRVRCNASVKLPLPLTCYLDLLAAFVCGIAFVISSSNVVNEGRIVRPADAGRRKQVAETRFVPCGSFIS